MRLFIRARIRSFRYAFSGWRYVLQTQPNARIHALVSVCVLVLAILLQLPARDWAIIILTICMVWAAEFFNTAIESVVDLASPQNHPLAKISKDVGAAAVLVTAIGSIFIGIILLGPPLWSRISRLFIY